MRSSTPLRAATLALLPSVLAQTYTTCNPTNTTCPADTGLDKSSFEADFTSGSSSNSSFSAATGTTLSYSSNGAEFTINKQGEAPTIQSNFYIFFGLIEITLRASPGTGIVSSIVLQSDDLDEIDWEWLGGNTATVETNYFGKGNTTAYDRAIYYPVTTPQDSFHTYSIDWTSERIQWIIDGSVVRTLEYADANGGSDFPQTPMVLKMGNWAGGGEGEPEGTVEWAGGKTDFSKSPFTMYVKNVKITNYNPATSYTWSDKSGSFESIKASNSTDSSSNSSSTMTSGMTSPSSTNVPAIDQNSGAAVSVTSTGASYSVNTASVSALNSGSTGVIATTEVPGATASSTTSASGSSQTGTSGAVSLRAGSMIGIVALLVMACAI